MSDFKKQSEERPREEREAATTQEAGQLGEPKGVERDRERLDEKEQQELEELGRS